MLLISILSSSCTVALAGNDRQEIILYVKYTGHEYSDLENMGFTTTDSPNTVRNLRVNNTASNGYNFMARDEYLRGPKNYFLNAIIKTTINGNDIYLQGYSRAGDTSCEPYVFRQTSRTPDINEYRLEIYMTVEMENLTEGNIQYVMYDCHTREVAKP